MTSTKPALAIAVIIVGSLVTTTAQAEDCVPSCRDGYICHQGQCIAACNPPCAEGEQCTGDGQCVADTSSAAAAGSPYAAVDTEGGGAISIATATPFLVRQIRAKKNWERQHASAFGRDLAVAPVLAPTPRNQVYGLTLRGSF